jgi:SPP1 gp7 family putative phage head morphogenesis protein
LAGFISALKQATAKVLDIYLPTLGATDLLQPRVDGIAEELTSMLESLRKSYDTLVPSMGSLIDKTADKENNFELQQWRKTMSVVLGVNLWQGEPWLNDRLTAWSQENVALIKKLTDDLQGQVRTIVQQGYLAGKRHETIRAEILGGTGLKGLEHVPALAKVENRAKLIARDQVSKLSGQLVSSRQQAAGITLYTWRTSMDERVRPSHDVMEGKLCRWDNSTVYSPDGGKTWISRPSGAVMLPPGQDYQCRCYAEPYFEDILSEAPVVPAGGEGIATVKRQRTPEQKAARAARRAAARLTAQAKTAPIKKVDDFIYYSPNRWERNYQEMLDSVNAVQALPQLEPDYIAGVKVLFKEMPAKDKYRKSFGVYSPGARNIRIHPEADDIWRWHNRYTPLETSAHEFGHHLDYVLGGAYIRKTSFAWQGITLSDSPQGAKIMNAIKSSEAVKNLQKVVQNRVYEYAARTPDGKPIYCAPGKPLLLKITKMRKKSSLHEHYEYLTSNHELFARAYCQYIGTHPKATPAMKASFEKIVTVQRKEYGKWESFHRQWTDEEFKPIAKAFDELFAQRHPPILPEVLP